MVIDFEKTLRQSQDRIEMEGDSAEFIVFDIGNPCSLEETEIRYGKALWTVIEIINKKYQDRLDFEFNLYNWIEHNSSDELSYFLNEASSNSINYSEFKSVWKLIVYFGKKGFIVGVLQQGKDFDAEKIFFDKVKSNEGAGFLFYEECSNTVFFDNSKTAKSIYFEYLFK